MKTNIVSELCCNEAYFFYAEPKLSILYNDTQKFCFYTYVAVFFLLAKMKMIPNKKRKKTVPKTTTMIVMLVERKIDSVDVVAIEVGVVSVPSLLLAEIHKSDRKNEVMWQVNFFFHFV